MKTGGRTALPRTIRPSNTESLECVERGAAMMEGITATEAQVVEPRIRPSVAVERALV